MTYQILLQTWFLWGFKFPPRRLQDAFQTPLDAPAWCPRGPKSHPRGAQDAPRTAQELPKRRPGSGPQAPWGEDTSQSSPRFPPDLNLEGFWMEFENFLKNSKISPPARTHATKQPQAPSRLRFPIIFITRSTKLASIERNMLLANK